MTHLRISIFVDMEDVVIDNFNYGVNKLEKLIEENYQNEYENIIISCTNLLTIRI